MNIIIYPVQTKGDLRKFIHLPAKIHKNHPNWVPPIYLDEWDFFNPKKIEHSAIVIQSCCLPV